MWSNDHNGQKNDEAAPVISVTQSKGRHPPLIPPPGRKPQSLPRGRSRSIPPLITMTQRRTQLKKATIPTAQITTQLAVQQENAIPQGLAGDLPDSSRKGDIGCADAQEEPQGDGGRDGERSGNFQFWDSATDDWSRVSPTYATAKRENRATSCGNKELGSSFVIPFDSREDRD